MADIELVIKIPEVDYKHFKELYESLPKDTIFVDTVAYYIGNGTPLPKGHGELVDIRPLMRGLYEEKCVGELTYTTSEVYRMLDDETTTIIEADTESEE